MRILVGGSLRHVPREENLCQAFVTALGVEIVKRNHILFNGCRSSLDKMIASAAEEWVRCNGGEPTKSILSYCSIGETPVHNFGTVRASALPDWHMNHAELRIPEQIEMADVTIFIAGREGTFLAKNWAHYAGKPILGIPRFGGAGEIIYDQERKRLLGVSSAIAGDYETLNQISTDVLHYAKDVVALAERMVAPGEVFTIMSFKREFRDVYESYKTVCTEFGWEAVRTDQSTSLERIVSRVEAGIRAAAFVIADVSEPSPNIFYEVGFARALGKDVIMTAKRGTVLPFDIDDIPTIFWEIQEDMKDGLRKCISGIKSKYGR